MEDNDNIDTKMSTETNIINPVMSAEHPSNETTFIQFLNRSYMKYRYLVQNGLYPKCLKVPQRGNVELYPWELILSRYTKQLNYFYVTKSVPYRIFIVKDKNIAILKDCIDINDIKIADISQYPSTVQNLLLNRDVSANFCILYGLSDCWQLMGSVKNNKIYMCKKRHLDNKDGEDEYHQCNNQGDGNMHDKSFCDKNDLVEIKTELIKKAKIKLEPTY